MASNGINLFKELRHGPIYQKTIPSKVLDRVDLWNGNLKRIRNYILTYRKSRSLEIIRYSDSNKKPYDMTAKFCYWFSYCYKY